MQRSSLTCGIALTLLFIPLYAMPAHGHGISTDLTPPFKFQDKNIALFIRMTPSFIEGKVEKGSIEIMVKNADTGENIADAVLSVNIIKDGKVLLSDIFNSPDGKIILEIVPTDTEKAWISAFWEPERGWKASQDLPALVNAPIFLDGGLYHYIIKVLALERNDIAENITFNAYVSIAKTKTYEVNGERLLVRTMYDDIYNFTYDNTNNIIRFSMPFNWNKTYISLVPIVHEEVWLPKSLSAENYRLKVNNVEAPAEAVITDNSPPDVSVIHIMLLNKHIMELAKYNPNSNSTEFELSIGTIKSEPSSKLIATSNKGTYKVSLSTTPAIIDVKQPATFVITFIDAKSGIQLTNVAYNFIVLKDEKEILRMNEQFTLAEVGTIQHLFQESDTGTLVIRIENINRSEEYAEFPVKAVPEFPNALMLSGIIALALLMNKFR